MICPPCAQAADDATTFRAQLAEQGITAQPRQHNPLNCRDAMIQPHGCTCQHGQRLATVGNEEQR